MSVLNIKVVKRFFLIYGLFFVCILLLLTPLYFIIENTLEQNVLRTNEEVLSEGLKRLENELSRISVASRTLYSCAQIVPLSYLDSHIRAVDGYRIRQACTIFSNITGMLSLPSDTGLILKSGTVLASGSFYTNIDEFYPAFFCDTSASSFEHWFSKLKRENSTYSFTTMCISRSNSIPRDVVVFAMELPINTNWKNSFFYAVLDIEDICNMLAVPEILQNSSLLLYDPWNNVELINYNPENFENMEQCVTITQTSDTYGLKAVLQIERAYFLSDLNSYKNIVIIALMFYVIVGVVLCLIFSYRNAKPVIKMLLTANLLQEELYDDNYIMDKDEPKDIYQYLNSFIEDVGSKLKTNKLKLMHQESQLKMNLFERLLRGEVYHLSTFEMAYRYFPELPECCCMSIIKLFHTDQMMSKEFSSIQISLREIIETHLKNKVYIHFTANLIVLILPSDNKESTKCYQHQLIQIGKDILSQLQIEVQTAVSRAFSDIHKLNQVFEEVILMLRLTGKNCSSQPVFQEDCSPQSINPEYHTYNASRFYELIIRGQKEDALALLDKDIDVLKNTFTPREEDLQQMFYVYRYALIRANNTIKCPTMTLPEYSKNSSDNIFNNIRSYAEKFCNEIKRQLSDSIEEYEYSILAHIDKNISNPQLCVTMITTTFSISSTKLQRYMREITSKSFLEYVDEKRMMLAHQLLTETDLPINQIAEKCGYTSQNSFYKAFKRRFCKSPSTMRDVFNSVVLYYDTKERK